MRKLFLLIVPLLIAAGCNGGKDANKAGEQTYSVPSTDSGFVKVADSIIYAVTVKNPNPYDDWTDYCLRNLDLQKLIDMILADVYAGKLVPYTYTAMYPEDEERIPVDSIKAWEEQIGKDKVARIEFDEQWFYDPETHQFIKKVNALTIGYELYDAEGQVRGYRALFKVYLSGDKEQKQVSK